MSEVTEDKGCEVTLQSAYTDLEADRQAGVRGGPGKVDREERGMGMLCFPHGAATCCPYNRGQIGVVDTVPCRRQMWDFVPGLPLTGQVTSL